MCVLVFLVVLSTLASLAEASPPDPIWIAGIYDDADYDGVIGFITSAAAAAEPLTDGQVRLPAAFIASPSGGHEGYARTVDRSAASVRAPPSFSPAFS